METLPMLTNQMEESVQVADDCLVEVAKRALVIGGAVAVTYWVIDSLAGDDDDDEPAIVQKYNQIKEKVTPQEDSLLSKAITSFAVTTMLGFARNTLNRFLSTTQSK